MVRAATLTVLLLLLAVQPAVAQPPDWEVDRHRDHVHGARILVLRDGQVVEEGHHDDLLARGGTYADLWHLQSGELQEEEALH